MKDDLSLSVQKLLDEGGGLEGQLTDELEAAGPEARAEAEALARIDAGLRGLTPAELSDDEAEAIATRIEQRLDETLARMPDPVAPPIFGDKEGQPPKKQVPVAPPKPVARMSSGEYSLANLTSLSVKNAPKIQSTAPLKRPPKVKLDRPQMRPAPEPVIPRASEVQIGAEDLEEVISDLPPALDVPPTPDVPPAPPTPTPPPTARKPLAKTDDRAKIPSVKPFDLGGAAQVDDLPPPPAELEERRKRNRTLFYWGSGLAAAAAVLVVAVTGLSTMGYEDEMAAAPAMVQQPASESLASAADETVQEVQEMAPGGAADYEATAVEAPEEAVAEAEAEAALLADSADPAPPADTASAPVAALEPETSEAEARSSTTMAARPRTRRSRRGAPRMSRAMAAMTSSSAMGVPDRAAVVRALNAVKPQVAACASGRGGTVNVNITVGSSGRVRNAVVLGQFAGTREGSCVARAVRRARFPEFQRDSFTIRYPFQL